MRANRHWRLITVTCRETTGKAWETQGSRPCLPPNRHRCPYVGCLPSRSAQLINLWKPTIDALDPLLGVRFCNWCELADDGAQTEATRSWAAHQRQMNAFAKTLRKRCTDGERDGVAFHRGEPLSLIVSHVGKQVRSASVLGVDW